jgi:rhamnogalacturonan endolyase
LADIAASTKVQDETWRRADGTYITKYDWQALIRDQPYYGVYGPGFGSWYINAGKDDYNGDHLKQELMVHRESSTGDVVQLNMLHGTHFMASSADAFPEGKVWGPWLWYLVSSLSLLILWPKLTSQNYGETDDASRKAKTEIDAYPYSWFDNVSYQSRGEVSGTLTLSDGRPAANAAVFLGDNNPNETALDMGRYYYYTTYADDNGKFKFLNVRSASYGLQAWANGDAIRGVSTTFLKNDVLVTNKKKTDLGQLTWKTQGRESIFQIGNLDRTSLGFAYGGAPHQHALVSKCPANLTYTIQESSTSDWCFGQSALGTWRVEFDIQTLPADSSAVLSVSLAGYSSGVSSSIIVNEVVTVGNLTSAFIATDPSMYRSGTLAGEWHYYEFPIKNGTLRQGWNTVDFKVTRTTLWHGFLWDSVMLEYA